MQSAKMENSHEKDEFPISNMYTGLSSAKADLLPSHKLEKTEAHYDSTMQKVQMDRIRKIHVRITFLLILQSIIL